MGLRPILNPEGTKIFLTHKKTHENMNVICGSTIEPENNEQTPEEWGRMIRYFGWEYDTMVIYTCNALTSPPKIPKHSQYTWECTISACFIGRRQKYFMLFTCNQQPTMHRKIPKQAQTTRKCTISGQFIRGRRIFCTRFVYFYQAKTHIIIPE